MNRIDRLFGISTLLQSNKFTSAEKIAEKFGISLRTVYRDLKSLNEQGLPICYEPQKGYHLVNGYFLPPVAFNLEEANALLLMEHIINAFSDKSIQKNYQSALVKIKSVLKQTQKDKIELLAGNMYFQLPDRLTNDYEFLSIIQTAISNKSILEFEYKDAKELLSKRKIEAIGLIFYAFGWHLIGWCQLRKDYRDFKVSRIVKIKDLEIPFAKESHIPLTDYLKQLPVTY
ncbi:MAG: YafY family transcriptional regulator [Bacteroidetes bacterium]|nr:YafY family transcriptional regulator [Bacteroidota bacterium]MBU1483763.1 YafY family transcriptional regulator [Bacteroidota bacterium]MBU2046611.1 YafY family transcriptional regulator [Bacteroidota bacterium]MBU2268203.1 YafY family transcriptional regulator [Bacteroidota bacterium]MBU2374624.1 YafY family transcriptional regulator [Bacteroidota bacterium]